MTSPLCIGTSVTSDKILNVAVLFNSPSGSKVFCDEGFEFYSLFNFEVESSPFLSKKFEIKISKFNLNDLKNGSTKYFKIPSNQRIFPMY